MINPTRRRKGIAAVQTVAVRPNAEGPIEERRTEGRKIAEAPNEVSDGRDRSFDEGRTTLFERDNELQHLKPAYKPGNVGAQRSNRIAAFHDDRSWQL